MSTRSALEDLRDHIEPAPAFLIARSPGTVKRFEQWPELRRVFAGASASVFELEPSR